MKKKEVQELKTKPMPELAKLLGEAREKLRVAKLDAVSDKLKDTSGIRKTKTAIARILTFIHEKDR